MNRITVLSLVFAIAILFGSCSVFQKNGKSTEKSVQEQPLEQSEGMDESNEEINNDW